MVCKTPVTLGSMGLCRKLVPLTNLGQLSSKRGPEGVSMKISVVSYLFLFVSRL